MALYGRWDPQARRMRRKARASILVMPREGAVHRRSRCQADTNLCAAHKKATMARLTCATAAGMATAGPTPMMAGSTPTAEKLLKMPSTGRPLLRASRRVIISTADAPSVTCMNTAAAEFKAKHINNQVQCKAMVVCRTCTTATPQQVALRQATQRTSKGH